MSKKTLFITGGNGEIGTSIKKEFADFDIISPSSIEMNCESRESIKNYISKRKIAKIEVLVHCAAINIPNNYLDISEESINKALNVNTLSLLYIVQELSEYLIDNHSKILAISSIYSVLSRNNRLEIALTKHALNGVIKTLAIELGERGIIVNSLSPGFIDTSLTRSNNTNKEISNIISKTLLKRLGTKEEISKLVFFLCSDNNTYLTAQNIIIDGGFLSNAILI